MGLSRPEGAVAVFTLPLPVETGSRNGSYTGSGTFILLLDALGRDKTKDRLTLAALRLWCLSPSVLNAAWPRPVRMPRLKQIVKSSKCEHEAILCLDEER